MRLGETNEVVMGMSSQWTSGLSATDSILIKKMLTVLNDCGVTCACAMIVNDLKRVSHDVERHLNG